ncbi:P-loop containing nucleoside triphosphate hydrolases superfamily protein [Thalictrum thalictroides]|uniref:P-loop containing nucleoside triphosphate hydrolases superfamily protein n=1 Tax=Thalictrum thalictroides TaxID=46969 RepID=A0A7J6VSG9_THATH|nr:P-loop containing nucleoside triphosphate hydrolases superfamily protein [Thalictrum thalictroides]
MREFGEFEGRHDLIEYTLEGANFTWSDNQRLPIMIKLDHFISSIDWDMHYGDVNLLALPKFTSDHRAIMIEVNKKERRPGPFRFDTIWLEDPKFRDLLKQWWGDIEMEGKANYVCTLTGSGRIVRFWLDEWCGEAPLSPQFPHLYRQARYKDGVVADHFHGGWDLHIRRRRPRGEEVHELELTMALLRNVVLNDDHDEWVWKWHCPESEQVWQNLAGHIQQMGGDWLQDDVRSTLQRWPQLNNSRLGSAVWKILPAAVLWSIWKCRNSVIFKGETLSRDNLIKSIKTHIDGFEQDKKVVVIAATNRKEDLDSALISRFDSMITFNLPDQQNRKEIAAQYAKHLNSSELVEFVAVTEEMSGRDIRDVCQQAERHWASKIIRGQVSSEGDQALLPPLQEYIDSALYRQKALLSLRDRRSQISNPQTKKSPLEFF